MIHNFQTKAWRVPLRFVFFFDLLSAVESSPSFLFDSFFFFFLESFNEVWLNIDVD